MSSFSDNYKAAGRAALGGKSLEDFNDYNTSIRLYADQNGKKYLIRLGNDAKHSELEKQGLTIRPVMRVVEDGKLRDYVADSEEDLEAIQHKGVETRPFVGLDNTLKWSHVDKDEFDKVREKDLELFYKRNEIFNNAGKEATETPGILKQLGMELARVGNETIAKPLVGLSTMINAGLHYVTGGNSNTVGRWFGENADYTADVYQKLNEFSANMDIRQYVDEDSWQYNTASVFQGITDLATQLLIAQGVSAATSLLTSTSVKTAAGVVNYGAAPAVQLAAPTFKQMAVQGAKEFVTGPGASYAVMQAGGSAGETFSEARANNMSMGEATWLATVDGMTSMALARVEKALGATFGGGSTLQQGYIRIFNSPAKWQIAKDIAKGVGIEMASEAADTYSHMSFLQAAGAEIYEEDKWMAMGTAILYAGFASGIAEGAGYMQQRGDIQRMRKDYAAARTYQSDLARQNPTVVKNIENGQPTLIEGSIPGGVKMVEANGDVRFGDGTVSHIDGSMTTVTGVVVDNNGSIVTAGPAKSEGVELDLFKLIRGGDMTVYNIPLNEISVNERITQFKNDANPDTGEVIPLEGQFQPIPTKPILIMEFDDGRKEVVTGRHRLGLARRNGLETIPCNIIREKDGWTIEMAKTMDAYDNILDNQGSDKDFVDFFRHSRVTDEEIRHHKELISRPRQRMAYDVARGASEDLYSYVSAENKYVTLDVAAAISQNAPMGKSPMAESIQRAALRAALDGMRATEVAIYTRSLAQAYADKVATAGVQQLDLFGGDDTFELAMQVQARYASRKVAEIDLDLQSFRQILGKKSSTLTARQSLLDKYSIANVEDVQAIRSVMETLEQKKLEWKNYHLNPELSKEARDYAHKQLHIEPVIVETPSGEMMTVSQLESELSLDDESRRRIEAENAIDAGLSDNDTIDLFEQNASYKTSLWEAFEEPYWTQWRDSAPSPEMFRVRSYLVSRMLDRAKKTVDPATSLPFYSEIDRLSAMMKNIPRIEQNVIPLDHGDVSIDDVEKMFYSYMGEKPKTKRGVQSEPNADKDVLALAQRLFALARKYDIRFKFDSINDIFVFGKSRAGDIVLSYEAFGSSYLSDMTKGSVILHEITHSLTSWGLDAKGNVDPRAPEAWKNAWKDFEQTYDAMKKELRTLHYPATRNASEFVANLGMPAFRAELRQMNLWERTWDAIKRFVTRLTKTEEKDPRVREVDLLNESLNRLDVLLSNIDEQMFIAKRDAFRLEANKKRLKYFSGRGGDGSVMFVNEPVVPRRMDVTVDDETKTTKSDSSRLETFDGFEQPELFVAGNTNPNYIQDTLFDKPNNVLASKYKAGWYRIMSNDAYETRIQEMTTEQLGWEIYQNELIVEAMEEYRSKFNGSDERKAKLDADIQRAKEQVTRAEEVIRLRKDFQASTGVTYKAGHISIDDVERMYHHYAKGDKALAALAQRLFKFARQYNLTFNMANIRSSDKLGEALRGDIAFSLDVFNHKLISNEDKASTILHEIIHGLTTWGRSYTTRKAKIDAPEAWKKAWSELDNMYQELKPQLQRMKLYGATNVDEFVAELSNPTFRAELKRRNLWERAWGAVKRFVRYLIGDENGRAKEVNALDAALERLDTLLDNIDSDLIAEEINIGKTRRRSPFHHMKKEGEVRFDSDYDKAIRLGDFTDNPIASSDVVPPEPTMQMELNLDGIQSDNWYQTTLFRNAARGSSSTESDEALGRQNTSNGRDNQDLNYARSSFGVTTNNENVEMLPEATVPFGYVAPELDPMNEAGEAAQAYYPRSILEVSIYPNGGRVPVMGSPADKASRLPLSLPQVVAMYRQLSRGKTPIVVSNKAHGPRQALGWYRPDAQTISVRSQLFGLADQSDVIFLHDKLKERGFFKHEDPEWCSTVTRAEQEHERNASTQNLEKALARMIDNRVKTGYHQGAGVKVLAHELWHMIDDTDGGQTIKEKKTFLDHLRNVKREFSDIAGEQLFNKVSKNEVISFLEWWQGAPLGKYGSKPRELYAEIGCAFCLDPGSMREKAPNLYEAMVENLQRHPQALNAWKALDDEILKGTDLDQTFQRLNATWEKNAEIERRKARDEINRNKNNAKMKMAHIFLDRYQPIIMVVEESQRDIREKLKKDFNDGHISQQAYNRGIEMLDKELLDIKYQRNLYTHQYGRSKIFLADLNEQVLKVAKERNVTMRDLNTYLHLKRVIEIQNRATAHGIDAPTAHRMLKRMEARLGAIQMNNIVTVAKTFRAIYERSVIDNPDVQEMLGSQSIEMMRKNQHYVTMRHTVDPEKIEEVNQAKTGDALLDAALNDLRGLAGERTGGIGYTLHKLEGSFRATISPILATAQTAITILETAQRNHALIQLSQTLQNHRQRDFRVLNPGEKPFNTKRYGVLSYMKDGKIEHIMVPRPVADAINAESYTVNTLTLANRIMNAGFTTNSLAFIPSAYMRDLASLSQNNPGLRRSFLHYATVMNLGTLLSPLAAIPGVRRVSTPVATLLNVGSWASFAAQFIPPHVMKRISQNPIGRLLLNNKTVEYWSSYGHTCAKIIQTMNFEGTLKAAADARAKGQHAKARELEYCAIMARHALEDGVLLTMNQLRRDDYSKADIARVFEKYNLKYELDEDITPLSSKIRKYLKDLKKRPVKTLTAGVIEGAKKAVSAYWESSGYLSELEAMTVKLSGYCAFHAQRAGEYGYATGDTRTNVALQTVEMAGDPDFTKKGMLANQIEMFFSPFWNARKEGTRRTVRALKNNPRDWTSKMLLDGVLPRVASLLLSSGVAAGLLLKAFSKNEDPRELEGTLAGDVYDYLVWQQKALKNETIYTKTNYRCLPVWMSQDGHTSFCLRTPIPDEIKAAEMAVIAAWNVAGLDSDMPNTNAGDAVATFMRQFFPDLEGRGSVVSHFRNIVYPWLLDTNPYERHLNRNLYTDEEFAARWTRPYAIETTLKNAWNNTPLVNMKRFQLRSHVGNVSEDAVSFKELLETPIVGPVLARFGSLSSAGIEQTASQFVEINKVEQAARSLDVKRAAKDFYLEGKPLPEDISGDWEALDQFLKEVKKIDNRESLSPRERAIKKIDSIREDNPELWERAFKNLHNTPRYTDGRRI
ncbi:MAG: hypothetical protein Q4C03_00250 [bacterium]|nr:hypothetical protein [bacterium]